ncbi:response regulator [Chryseolinea lacunae]|uniref:Response regulator n=1 Tax=Chryseolinea lacunae TaxID=2801331 RepID=A0ABS1KWU5_9BACT|nr:response regulator [Chryseolinea lacunae]MBL0743936.1 response regulator [Chryseolinea lacunae]
MTGERELKKIMLIEDDPDSQGMLKSILLQAGYAVDTTEGTAIVAENYALPDVFVLDNFMPAIHGVALCKFLKLKEHTRSIPVVIMSGDPEVQRKAENAGAALFLRKPFHRQDLLDCIEAVLNTGDTNMRKTA